MKLLRLDLVRYGHLSDVRLDFPPDACLHVVLGVNEAGKSTALAALEDALFGFGHITRYDFLYPGPQMRLGLTLQGPDGASASFVRRKGRGSTLSGADGTILPDDALRPFLGGIGREAFSEFGLNATRLRQGAEALLQSGGEAGESLLAGMGVPNLHAALGRLDEEAGRIFGDRRGTRVLGAAAEAWQRARRALDQAVVTPPEWHAATAEVARIAGEIEQARQAMDGLGIERSRLERVRRCAGLIRSLEEERARLAAVADAVAFPADAEATVQAARHTMRSAEEQKRRAEAKHAELAQRATALVQDDKVLAEQDAIDALREGRSKAAAAEADLPKVQHAVSVYRARVQAAAGAIDPGASAESLLDRLPTRQARQKLQQLVGTRRDLVARMEAANQSLTRARHAYEQATRAVAEMPVPAPPAPLRLALDEARALGPIDDIIAQAERTLADAGRASAGALAALAPGFPDIESLARCRVPPASDADAIGRTLTDAAEALAAARARVADIGAAIDGLRAELAAITEGETVPTPQAVAEARAARDRTWQLIRRALHDGDARAAADRADGFEALRDQADRLADRRADDAGRVARFLSATGRLHDMLGNLAEARSRLADAEHVAEEADRAWRALWAPAGIPTPLTPAAMAQWQRQREAVLRLAESEADARRRRDELIARRAAIRAPLARLLTDVPAGEALRPLLPMAQVALEQREGELAAYRECVNRTQSARKHLDDEQQHAADTAAKLAASDAAWRDATAQLGIAEDATPDEVEAVLAAWNDIAEAEQGWRSDARRIADMQAEVSTFTDRTEAVLTRLGDRPLDGPATVRVAELARRLDAARKAASEAASLDQQMRIAASQARDAQRDRDEALATLTGLRERAGAADDDALDEAIARARRREEATARIDTLERELALAGDGKTERELRSEAAGFDIDAVKARLDAITAEQKTIGERQVQLGAARAAADAKLDGLRAGRDAAAHAQAAENALADARAAAERYATLHMARTLLRAAVERIRAQAQAPLLQAAGRHFAQLTGGRYTRLHAEHDDRDRTVLLAVRDDGESCPMDGLSDGTRDQLFLALRLAAIARHVESTGPMPVILDDVLVQFDDERAARAIATLCDLGRTTQVILFTHHGHIAELARAQPGVSILRMPEPVAAG